MVSPSHSTTHQDAQGSCSEPKKKRGKIPGYPKCDGTNTGRLGLFRRMAPHPEARFAAIHVVTDRDDEGPAAAGANVLGPVVSILPLSMDERVDFAELANTPRKAQSKEEIARENAMWQAILDYLSDDDPPLAVLAIHLVGAIDHIHIRDLAERHVLGLVDEYRKPGNEIGIETQILREPHDDVPASVSFI